MHAKAYDAIISDYQMPVMDGIAFLKTVRASGNTIPFILFTGRGREEVVIQALNEGADFYLQKGGEPVSQFTELGHQIRLAVTQRRAEVTIRDHDRRVADIINFLPDATFAIDKAGAVIAWNWAMEKMTGVKAAEILGEGNYAAANAFYHERRPMLADLVLAPAEEFEKQKYSYTIRDSSTLTAETTIERPDGTHTHLWGKASRLLDENGNLAGAIESVRDITDRKDIEDALKQEDAQLRQIIDLVPHMIFAKDREGKYLLANRAVAEGYNTTVAVIVGRPQAEFHGDPAELRQMLADDREVMDTGKTKFIPEEPYIDSAGNHRFLQTTKVPFTTLDSHQQAVLGIAIDITDRKLAEEELRQKNEELLSSREQIAATEEELRANVDELTRQGQELRESEERYRRLISQSFDAVIVHHDGRIVLANHAAARILGYASPGELAGRPVLDCVLPEFRATVAERVRQMLASPAGTVPPIEEKFVRIDGVPVDVEVMATATRHEGGPAVMVVFRDITERRQSEEALKESEEKYRLVVENSQDAIYIHRSDRLLFANSRAAELTGYTHDELMNIRLWDLVHPDDRTILAERAKKRLAGEEIPSGFTARLLTKGGTERSCEFFVDTVMYQGAPAILGIARDLTESRRAEEELRENEARLKRAEEIGRSGNWEFRLDDHMVWASGGARILYGLGGEQWTIPDVQKIPLPEYRALLDGALRDLIAGRAPYNVEFKIRREPDGAILDIHSVAEYDAGRNVVFGVIHDVTERKRAEEEVLLKNAILSTQQETAPEGIFTVDGTGKILNYNQSFIAIFGIPPDLIASGMNEPVLQYAADQIADGGAFLSRVHYLYDHKEEKSFEEILLRDGRILERFSSPVLGEGGRYYGRVWYFRDITDRRRAAEALARANKNLKLLSVITRHDIRNQLTVLNAHLALLEKERPEVSSGHHFGQITDTAERISSMIQFTGEYEEMGASAPAWQDCRDLVDNASGQFPAGKARVTNDIPAGTEVLADPLIARVFYNLMDNAVRYGGTITGIRFSAEKSGGRAVLVCEDDGEGIPAVEKEKIFERGFGKNTGLGLFLAREILSITGITIRETGVPGKGARFEITVPEGGWRVRGEG